MNTVESAYQKIANGILWFVDGHDWKSASAKSSIWTNAVQTSYMRSVGEIEVQDDKFPELDLTLECAEAALFLRNDLLKSTGQRIWGLTFTLYPDGKFNLEYDYNKPEGYEESDEVITGGEINASLKGLLGDNNQS